MKNLLTAVFALGILATFFAGGYFVFTPPSRAFAQSNTELREKLEKELADLEKKIAEYDQNINATAQEKKSLQSEINKLKNEINRLDLEVRRTGVMIRSTEDQIAVKELDIAKAEDRIEQFRFQLEEIMRRIWYEDQRQVWDIILNDAGFSGFMNNVTELLVLQTRNNELLYQIKATKLALEGEHTELEARQDELEKNARIQTLQRQQQEQKRQERDSLLKLTEAQYEQFLESREQAAVRATEIRARIFELVGVTDAPTFGEASEIAKEASQSTGVRAAFLLAILTQESNLGKNVGQCYLRDPQTGAGVGANTGTAYVGVMAPGPPYHSKRNDVAIFLEITKTLGRDPYNTRVSCPIDSVSRGLIAGKNSWGGAMGPAQFIPTTWRGYEPQIKALAGSADPWKIRDAFTAAALMLKKSGAASQAREAEWRAALVYFSGGVNTQYRFYADSVLAIADRYEADIKALEGG